MSRLPVWFDIENSSILRTLQEAAQFREFREVLAVGRQPGTQSTGAVSGSGQTATVEPSMGHHVSVPDEFLHPVTRGDASMARLGYTSMLIALVATCASAQAQQGGGSAAQIMSSIPANSETITHWYKQSVYDPKDSKIGEIVASILKNVESYCDDYR
jgi:hypothetical protein